MFIFICGTGAAGRVLLSTLPPILRLATIVIRVFSRIRLPSVSLQVKLRSPGVLAAHVPSRR